MEELEETIKNEVLKDITANDVLEFKKHPYAKKDFPGTEVFNKLWYAFDRELNWREKVVIDEIKRVLDDYDDDIRNTKLLSDDILELQRLDDIRMGKDDMLEDICLEIMG